MMKWIIPCNINKYNVVEAFKELKQIDWRQNIRASVGDTVFIYVSSPIKAILFKCSIVKTDITTATINDSKFVIDGEVLAKHDKYMRLELDEQYAESLLPFEELQKHGLKSVQGPVKIAEELDGFIEQKISEGANYLKLSDITDNVLIIKINRSYREDMSALELYDVTRGCWKRKIESVSKAKYALSVSDSIVREVYRIDNWKPSKEVRRETIDNNPKTENNRITFSGEIAQDTIRLKYLNKNVKQLFKPGEADPLKLILGENNYKILRVSDDKEYNSIYGALNENFGTDYDGWMKAVWTPNKSSNFCVWFPKLAYEENGKKKAAANDCLNVLSEDGTRLVYDDLKKGGNENSEDNRYVVIFAKPYNKPYKFVGVFLRDNPASNADHTEFYRISTEVRIIGSPAETIEPIESEKENTKVNDINIAVPPREVIERLDGSVQYVCSNCSIIFIKAPRCPECGQLVKI